MDKHLRQLTFEQQFIGLIIKNRTLWDDKMVNDTYFYHQYTKEMYQLIDSLLKKKKPLDRTTWMTLSEGELERIGGLEFIYSCLEQSGEATIDAFERNQKEIETYHIATQMIENVKRLEHQEYYDLEECRDVVDKINDGVNGVSTKRKTLHEKLAEMHQKLMNKTDELGGVDTGFSNLNEATDGWEIGSLVLCGARPSMGKTAVTLNMGLKSTQKNVAVTYVASETGDYSILERGVSILGSLPVNKMKNPLKNCNEDQLKRYQKALMTFKELPFAVEGYQCIKEIRQLVRDRKREEPAKHHIIFIDHLGHLKITGENFRGNRNLEYEEYCKKLKDIARDYGVVVVLLSQLSRAVEQREDKRPQLSDLRDSGSIEAIADVVLFLYRENYYLERAGEEPNKKDIIEVGIAKNRNGAIGNIFFEFNPTTMQIREASKPQPIAKD